MKKTKWLQKTHLLRADEYICPVCGTVSDKPYLYEMPIVWNISMRNSWGQHMGG